MSGKRDIRNYPEHLNPFREDILNEKLRFWTLGRKRTNSFSNSFKEFKNSVRQSFRGKKSSGKRSVETSPVQLRKHQDLTNYRQTQTLIAPRKQELSPLPRSRFSERVINDYSSDIKNENKNGTINKELGKNPFDDAIKEERKVVEEKKRKRKKKAPLPPLLNQSINEESNINNLNIPNSNSKWSLASAETDISCVSNYSPSEISEEHDESNNEIAEAFKNFSKDIEKLTDDSNNNILTEKNNEKITTDEIPDIVVSCENNQENSFSKVEECDDATQTKYNEEVEDNTINEETENYNNKSDIKENGELVMDTPYRPALEEDIKHAGKDFKQKLLYFEKKALYIDDSNDELSEADNDIKKCNGNGNISINDDEENTENNPNVPTPKIRKNKLNKNTLLGNDLS